MLLSEKYIAEAWRNGIWVKTEKRFRTAAQKAKRIRSEFNDETYVDIEEIEKDLKNKYGKDIEGIV